MPTEAPEWAMTDAQPQSSQPESRLDHLKKLLHKGKTPFRARIPEVDEAAAKLRSEYFVRQPDNQPHTLSAIEASFSFASLAADSEFKWLHVEPLVNQAANLLDRCLLTRTERDELAIQKFNLERDLEEFFGTYDIYNDEIAAGLFTVPYERSVYEALAENEQEAYEDAARLELKKIIDHMSQNYDAERRLRWYGMLISETAYQPQNNLKQYNDFPPFSPGNKYEVASKITNELSESEFTKEMRLLFSQYSSHRAAVGASSFRKRAMELMADWNERDIEFKQRRKLLSLKIALQRAEQAAAPNGVLNYAARKTRAEQQFALDFREALARLIAVQQGMQLLYGYTTPPLSEKASLDEAVLWTRTAINWLVRFSEQEQNYVLPVSLKSVSPGWKSGGDVSFDLDETYFPNQCHVRLRGLGAAVVGAKSNGIWQIRVHAPVAGHTRFLDGSVHDIDQRNLPLSVLGRVTNRYSPRDSDIVGITALHNASPLGTWTVSISKNSLEGIPTSRLDDLQIDLHVAVRTI